MSDQKTIHIIADDGPDTKFIGPGGLVATPNSYPTDIYYLLVKIQATGDYRKLTQTDLFG